MWQDVLGSGELLLSETPSASAAPVEAGPPLAAEILVLVFVVSAIFLLRSFLELLPYLWDTFFRARGSFYLENSVRVSHDRNLIALSFLTPAVLIMNRYHLYEADFLQQIPPQWHIPVLAGVLAAYLLLRRILFAWMKPRRKWDFYVLSHKAGYTYFILLMILLLATVGILSLTSYNNLEARPLIYGIILAVYCIYLLRRSQILSLGCNRFRTFLYLCGLEFLPTGILVLSAIFL